MRVAKIALSLLFILTYSVRVSSQEVSSQEVSSQQSIIAPPRNPQALAALVQMLAAAGWLPGSLPGTVTSSGTLTHLDGDQQQSELFTLKQRGPTQHRLDVVESGATTTTLVNGLVGIIRFADGTKYRLPIQAALSIQSPIFPFFFDVAKANDSIDVEGRRRKAMRIR